MKNKAALLIMMGISTIALSACSFFSIFRNNSGEYTYQDIEKSSSNTPHSEESTPSESSSVPPTGEITASKASYRYSDVIDNSVYCLSATPSVGNTRILVIPVWFTDSSTFIKDNGKKEAVRSDIEKTYFGKNTDTRWRTVKTYYEEQSYGAFTLSGTVSEWYSCGKSYSYYATDPASYTSGAPKTSALVETATNWYFSNHTDESRRDYDSDNDGYIDGVMLIYGAPNYTSLKRDSYSNLWAFCFWIQDPDVQSTSNPGVNAFFWASYDFMYGSEVASSRSGSNYHGGDTSHCNLDAHTYIHEMGHMFGLEDYYDYSEYSYQPAAAFSMQDHNVGGHDPFSVFALGWGKAYIPTSTIDINLKPFTTSGEMILLTPSWNESNSPFDEYLLLEYYTNDGLNAFDTTYKYMSDSNKKYPDGSKTAGIRLWHVDARLVYTSTNRFYKGQMTTNPNLYVGGIHQRVALMMSNTYYDGTDFAEQYCSVLGSEYSDYNLLQMIRNSRTANYYPEDMLSESALFKAGDSFSMSTFSRQFVNSGKFNSKKDLGFTFTVNSCNGGYASISVKKI